MPRSNGTPEAAEISVFDIFASAETTTVYLDPAKRIWVRLVNELDYGQANELENAALRGVEITQARAAVEEGRLLVMDLNKQRLMKLALYIDDWSLPHKWPAKLDERRDVCARLKPRWATTILAEIERLEQANVAPDDDQDADPNVMTLPSRAVESAATSSS